MQRRACRRSPSRWGGGFPLLAGKQIARRRQGAQPPLERFYDLAWNVDALQRLLGDALCEGELIFGQVVEFVDQEPLMLFLALALTDIDENASAADRRAAGVGPG